MGLAERFGDERALLSEFVVPVENLPGRGGEIERVTRRDAMGRGMFDFCGDALEIRGFAFGEVESGDGLPRQGVPEKDLFAVVGRGGVVERAEGLAAGGKFCYVNH